MEMIIAILLWLNVMVSGGTYTSGQVDQMIQQNESTIQAVLQDSELQNTVWQTTGEHVPSVVIGEGS